MKKAIIICSMDAYANAVKPKKLQAFLKKHRYKVELYPTNYLSRWGSNGLAKMIPGPRPSQWLLYGLEFIHLVGTKAGKKSITSFATYNMIRSRGRVLASRLHNQNYDLLICENSMDESLVLHERIARVQILDLPSPLGEELYWGGDLQEKDYQRLRQLEIDIYKHADYLSFHWHTYADYVKKTKYQGDNFIDLDYGTEIKTEKAKYAKEPRIIFLGYLAGYWVNLPLLAELSKIYPIDVYGGPADPGNGINYKGYAPSLDILADYQFGLVTVTKDELRRHSFSSKQLEYYSYGLPVLSPDWRTDSLLDEGAILYNPKTFKKLIKQHSQPEIWQPKAKAARTAARTLSWNRALKPLEKIVKDLDKK